MALNETTDVLRKQLAAISKDLDKSLSGNKSAAQRVRTRTIELAKIAKIYRKESLDAEKKGR